MRPASNQAPGEDRQPKSGHAFRLAKGQLLRVTDVEGEQIGDVLTNRDNPILTITEDPVGVHDFLYPPCNRVYYERIPRVEGKTGRRDHLFAPHEPLGLELWQITDPFGIFMNTGIDEAGRPAICRPESAPVTSSSSARRWT